MPEYTSILVVSIIAMTDNLGSIYGTLDLWLATVGIMRQWPYLKAFSMVYIKAWPLQFISQFQFLFVGQCGKKLTEKP